MKLTYFFLTLSLLVLNPLIAGNNPVEKKSNLKKSAAISTTHKKVSFAPDVVDNEVVKESSEIVVQQCSPTKECVKGIVWGTAALALAYISTELGLSAFEIWSFSLHRFAPVRNSYLVGGLLRTGGCIALSSATAYALYQSIQAFKKAANKNNK